MPHKKAEANKSIPFIASAVAVTLGLGCIHHSMSSNYIYTGAGRSRCCIMPQQPLRKLISNRIWTNQWTLIAGKAITKHKLQISVLVHTYRCGGPELACGFHKMTKLGIHVSCASINWQKFSLLNEKKTPREKKQHLHQLKSLPRMKACISDQLETV